MMIDLSERELSLLLVVLSELDCSELFEPEPDDQAVADSLFARFSASEIVRA